MASNNIADMNSNKFIIKESPGKGFGLFASCKLKRGELILEEKPLFKVNYYQNQNETDKKISKLSPEAKKIFNELTDCHSPKSPTPYGIVQTNALPLGNYATQGGIFPLLSRINHSCLPNVHHNWNPYKEMETIYAIRDIEQEEEILTSYIDLYNDKDTRQQLLKSSFNFNCNCELCSIKDETKRRKSDIRRNILKQLDEEIPNTANIDPNLSLQKCQQILDILKQENLDYEASYVGRVAYDAFSISYQTVKKNLEHWAKMAIDNHLIYQGYLDCIYKKELYSYYKKDK
jgi:hypothetical protein